MVQFQDYQQENSEEHQQLEHDLIEIERLLDADQVIK